MFNTKNDVIKYIHDNLDICDVSKWVIGETGRWRLCMTINGNPRTVLYYIDNKNYYYFITKSSLNNLLIKKNTRGICSELDDYPTKPSRSDDEYFQLLTSEDVNINVVDVKNSVLLFDISDKILNSEEYKSRQ